MPGVTSMPGVACMTIVILVTGGSLVSGMCGVGLVMLMPRMRRRMVSSRLGLGLVAVLTVPGGIRS